VTREEADRIIALLDRASDCIDPESYGSVAAYAALEQVAERVLNMVMETEDA
jgi:nitrogen-specific signal transduction histidine kinase